MPQVFVLIFNIQCEMDVWFPHWEHLIFGGVGQCVPLEHFIVTGDTK